MNGMMRYLKAIGVEVDDYGMLLVSRIVSSTTLGEMTREGFVDGWQRHV
jgi:DCN1-like protein 1/2